MIELDDGDELTDGDELEGEELEGEEELDGEELDGEEELLGELELLSSQQQGIPAIFLPLFLVCGDDYLATN